MDISFFISPKQTSSSYLHMNINSLTNNNGSHHHYPPVDMHSSAQSSHTSTTSRSSDSGVDPNGVGGDGKWASRLLRECAAAISDKDSTKIHHLLWMLNELASPYGDCDQKLASYFLQALFCKATDSGRRCYKTLASVAEKSHTFDSARKLILKFQEVSPWTTFGHVASNGAILDALEGENKLHIIDISNTLCTQWPTLLESLATRNDETPHLKLTVVITTAAATIVMKEISQRMEKFARLMGVPFEFNVVVITDGLNNHMGGITKESLNVQEDEAVAINCVGALRRVRVEQRSSVIRMLKSLHPRVVTIVEEEADFTNSRDDFVKCFEECLRFTTLYFDMLEDCFPPTSNERLMLERECSRSIVRVLACNDDDDHEDNDDNDETRHPDNDVNGDGADSSECRERGVQWSDRLREAAFSPVGYSDDVIDDVKALLKRYRAGWSLQLPQGGGSSTDHEAGVYLTWKEEPVVWASAWKP